MQFAKIFDFPTGQLLVEQDWVRIGSGGAGYSSLLIKTKYQPAGGGPAVTATAKTVYPTAQECAADFNAFEQGQATRVFESHQRYLTSGRETTFSTNHEVVFERPGVAVRPLVSTQQQTS